MRFVWIFVCFLILCSAVSALRCYEGTVPLDSNEQTAEKECGGISSYCLQTIDKSKNILKRSCSSFSDEHNMEERCPMTGCHWQSSKETFCCCQFDLCNEWKSDGTEFKKGETHKPTSAVPSKSRNETKEVNPAVPRSPAKIERKNSEIRLE